MADVNEHERVSGKVQELELLLLGQREDWLNPDWVVGRMKGFENLPADTQSQLISKSVERIAQTVLPSGTRGVK